MDKAVKEKKYADIILNVDEANQACVDCKSNQVTYISINNGVTLCYKCAARHFELGPSISYIRLLNDEWDDYLFDHVIFGGNTKFLQCLKSFSIEDEMEIEEKYLTKACDYYRKALRAKVKGEPLDEKIDASTGKEMCTTKEAVSEFEDYKVKTSKGKSAGNPLMKVQGFLGSIGKKTWGEMKKAGQFVAEKTAPATDKLKQAGQFVADKTAPATDKIKQGANFVSLQVKNVYTDVKDKFVGKKIEEENAIEVNINEAPEQAPQDMQPNVNKEDLLSGKEAGGNKEEGEKSSDQKQTSIKEDLSMQTLNKDIN